jgi:flagellar hook-basal body complex protein FliE
MVDAAHMKNVNSLLGQIRDYQTQAQQGVSLKPDAASETSSKETVGFGAAVKGALNQVNSLQQASEVQKVSYELGQTDSLPNVVLSMQKASMAFEATVQVRNKVLKAYEEILNMPV